MYTHEYAHVEAELPKKSTPPLRRDQTFEAADANEIHNGIERPVEPKPAVFCHNMGGNCRRTPQ